MIICSYSIKIIAVRVYLCNVQIYFHSNKPFCYELYIELSGDLKPLLRAGRVAPAVVRGFSRRGLAKLVAPRCPCPPSLGHGAWLRGKGLSSNRLRKELRRVWTQVESKAGWG